jgi:large subunit ribosomal protein L24e
MKKEECTFSGLPIYPGHGRKFVPFAFLSTKPVLPFALPRCFALYLRKKNPREVPWTRTFRRLRRKTTTDRVVRRRTFKVKKVDRAIVGADLAYIQEVRAKKGTKDRTAANKAAREEVAARKAAGKTAAKPAPKKH